MWIVHVFSLCVRKIHTFSLMVSLSYQCHKRTYILGKHMLSSTKLSGTVSRLFCVCRKFGSGRYCVDLAIDSVSLQWCTRNDICSFASFEESFGIFSSETFRWKKISVGVVVVFMFSNKIWCNRPPSNVAYKEEWSRFVCFAQVHPVIGLWWCQTWMPSFSI